MKSEQVSEATIATLVDRFYARIREDSELGPIFEAVIGEDWDPHLETMRRFWSSVMLTSGRYKGNPVLAHRRLAAVRPEHFARWLALFADTVEALFAPPQAAVFIDKSRRIADSLQLAMFFNPERPADTPATTVKSNAPRPRRIPAEERIHD